MCVLAFAWRAHPRWRLVLAGNRDELHARPATPLARWGEPSHVVAGMDLQSGGTWLGVSEQGRLAVVTNLRGHGSVAPDKVSRGALVNGMLSGDGPWSDAAHTDLSRFNPFNLIVADVEHARFFSNQPAVVRSTLTPGIYGLSNGALDEPWPKTVLLKSRLLEWVMNGDTRHETLLDDLRDETLPDVGIPAPLPSDVPLEPKDSPIFIRHPVYGTRCSTVVTIDERGQGIITERRYSPAGNASGETTVRFSWPG